MWKKLLVVGVIAAAVFAGFRATKHGRELINVWKAETAPTTEEKLSDLRKEVAKLDKDVEKVKTELAKEIVAVRGLTTETADLRASVDASGKSLMAQGEAIKEATGERVKYGTTTASIPVPEAKERLRKDVAILVQKQNTLSAKEKTLAQREAIRDTLQKQLDALVRAKQEMLAEIDAVEAEYKNLQLQQIEAKYQFDDSRLAKIKEQLRTIRNDVDVEKEKVRINDEVNPKLEAKSVVTGASETVDQILAPLNGNK
jgi:DNA repair exonuclease SbcCD ATPase subunit